LEDRRSPGYHRRWRIGGISPGAAHAAPGQALANLSRFESARARNFIEKSLSEDNRLAYTLALLDYDEKKEK